MDYKVDLESFRGPMDLLLYLVKRDEVDICDIPIAKIAGQFQAYLEALQLIDVEWAGEFLVMAATLMEIKSRMLLPRPEELTGDDEDPRLELVQQLMQYKKFKEAAALLEEQAEKQMTRLSRLSVELAQPLDPARQPLQRVELWDLVSAFGRLMRETSALAPRHIVLDDTPIHVHMERIMELLGRRVRVAFAEIFAPPHTRGRLLGLFLALLELIKSSRIQVDQMDAFGEIWLRRSELSLTAPPEEPHEADQSGS